MRDKTKLPKFHNFDGKKYHLKWKKPHKSRGECAAPFEDNVNRVMIVNPKQDDKEFIETLLHEALHAEQWYLDEETVTRIAMNLTELLDKCHLINK